MINQKIKMIVTMGVLALFVGCSNSEAPMDNKSQDEVQESVEKAIEVEPQEESLDIKDMDKLYEYFNENIFEVARDEFGGVIGVTYLDITGNGTDEAIILNDKSWDQPINIVTIEDNEYKVLSNKIRKAKYMNEFSLEDGFLVLKQKTGGTGVADTYLSLYKYHDEKLTLVLSDVYLEGHVSIPPNVSENYVSKIEGNYRDFQYLLVKEDRNANKREVMESRHYSYNEDDLSFTIRDTDFPEIETTIEEEVLDNLIDFKAGELLSGYGIIKYGNEEIDLNKYVAVALPMYSGKYSEGLEKKQYDIASANDKSVTVSMFGKYENVQIVYYANNNAEGEITKIGDLENTLLIVNGDFDNPEAYVRIECDVNGSDDRWSSSFNIDPSYDEFSNMQLMIE